MADILHVEDDPDLRKIMGMLLEQAPAAQHWHLTQVASAAEARPAMHAWEGAALLITDQRLPDGHGIALAREARRVRPDARRVILTALPDVPADEVDEVVEKPWGLDGMEQVLHGIVERWVETWLAPPTI